MVLCHPFFHQFTFCCSSIVVFSSPLFHFLHLFSALFSFPLPALMSSSFPPSTVPHLSSCRPPGKSNPYCEVTMGAQIFTSRMLNDTLNPKWNFNCQFHIKDLYQDVLCITVLERDQFSPDGQLPANFFLGLLSFSCLFHPITPTDFSVKLQNEVKKKSN